VFGAPEIQLDLPGGSQFLVVQPNFDVVLYLDRADAQTVGELGLFLENPKPILGPVQTAKIAHSTFYRALELGLNQKNVVGLLERSSQHPLPSNVVQTLDDWAAQRESLVVHSSVNLIGFADTASRDAFVQEGCGRPCGDRWIIAEVRQYKGGKLLAGALSLNHERPHGTVTINEMGQVTHGPLNAVYRSRLALIAEKKDEEYRIIAGSIHKAIAKGLSVNQISGWLGQMSSELLPALMRRALTAWTSKQSALQLDKAVVLGISDTRLFEEIEFSEAFKPLLLGTLGPGWLLVRPDGLKKLTKLLGEFGLEVTDQLSPHPLPAGR
jgi:hypothetical protein